jgi:hypothetical protein
VSGKVGLFSDTQARTITPLISDLDIVTQPETAPTQSPHLLCPSLATPLMGI